MTHSRLAALALIAGLAGGCGGGSSKHAPASTSTADQSSSTATTQTTTDHTGTTPNAKRQSLAQAPASTLKFKGTGPKELGVVRITRDSTIKWTNDGPLFQIIPASVHVQSPVNSRDHSGEAKIRKGAYHGFLINAAGNWTVSIVPGG